jgi:WXXGXW repeat (2 copies)
MKTAIQILMVLVLASCQAYGGSNESPPPIPSQEQPEVLNQGPIHEAFAQPVDLSPQAGIVAPNEPPADIKENPALEKPKGSDYVWIPGYWAWDAERKDYVWVSGCWRIPPANMSWIPGYWNKVPKGWQWVPGFWIPTARAGQIEYLPQPPELADVEPPADTTISGEIWVPPCYFWRENHYILRSGYWLVPQDNWVWIPAHYAWTPYGYVFVAGYWDHVLTTRGVLYAPVYFPRHFHRYPGYTCSLGVVVDLGNLEFGLFSYPRYCHYFFGDYYSDFYIGLGIYPWFDFEVRHSWYDPIFVYDRWHYRRTIPYWGQHIEQEYALRRANSALRPPRTYRELETRFSRTSERQRTNVRMVEPLQTYVDSKSAPFQFSRMSNGERDRMLSRTNEIDSFRLDRMRMETQRGAPEQGAAERRLTMPGRSSGRTFSARPSESERLGGRGGFSARQGFMNRSSSERMHFPRSPVIGRSSGGFFGFGRSTPSEPQREQRFERAEPQRQERSERGQNRESQGSRGRGRR